MGFFNLQPAASTAGGKVAKGKGGKSYSGGKKIVPIRVLNQTTYKGCASCPLDKEADKLHTPKMQPMGSAKPLLYIVGEFPTKQDDEIGEPFTSRGGEWIRNHLPVSIAKQTRWNNAVQCRLPQVGRVPTVQELASCSSRLEADIEKTRPLIVAGLGYTPLRWLTDQEKITAALEWQGSMVPLKVGNWTCWYMPLLNPNFLISSSNKSRKFKASLDMFERQFERMLAYLKGDLDLPVPEVPDEDELSAGIEIELSWDVDAVEAKLEEFARYKNQSVDIETNGLRPYFTGAKILSIAFGTWEHSYAIPIDHRESKWSPVQRKKLMKVIRRHLTRKGIKFWAHHAKFEAEWMTMPFGWGRDLLFEMTWHDTMAQAHVLNTNRGYSSNSLDARSMALLGVHEKTIDELDRARLDFEPLDKVLTYNARDTKFTNRVQRKQSKEIREEGLQAAYQLMVNRVPCLTLAQQLGVVPNFEYAAEAHKRMSTEIAAIKTAIQKLPEVQEFIQTQRKPFNSGSPEQLKVVLRDIVKAPEGWRVDEASGAKKYSTDEKVLSAIKHPIGKLILEERGRSKLLGTYIAGLCKPGSFDGAGKLVWDDGLIHTIYNYLLTTTGRLSSEDPNLQNFPSRTDKWVRDCIMAMLGYLIVSIDYGQIEARVIAMASECPVLYQALWDHYDIHMAWAEIIAKAHPNKIYKRYIREAKGDDKLALKLLRKDVKNQWTFPLFYGSVLQSVAASFGINPDDLEPQVNEFWGMFKAVKQWQRSMVKGYERNGYVETLTGRRRHGPLTLNEIINSPIQGTASDIVVESMEECALEAYRRQRWQLAARMNIHDDLTFYLPEETIEEDLDIIIPIMAQPRFDFINVPISVEISVGNGWGSQKELATVESTEYGYPQVQA